MLIETPGDTGTSNETENSTNVSESPKLEISAADLGLSVGAGDDTTADDATDDIYAAHDIDKNNSNPPAPDEKPELIARPAPKSWPKEMHEFWGKTDPKVQDYWETREKQMLDGLDQYKGDANLGRTLKEVITPYKPILESAGLDETTAVRSLLNAHYRLTQGTVEQRKAAYDELGKNLGLIEGEKIDPQVRQLQEKLTAIESTITTSQQRALQETQAKVSKDVEAFASDPKHPYFDEVADDIVAMIQAGRSLDDAYEKAVWANPVTRQKEMARLQTENDAKLKEKAKQEALKAKQASSTNVKGRDTRRSPTEPKGTMEDTMKETLREIKTRAH